jgi:tripeptidyl-peptidase I
MDGNIAITKKKCLECSRHFNSSFLQELRATTTAPMSAIKSLAVFALLLQHAASLSFKSITSPEEIIPSPVHGLLDATIDNSKSLNSLHAFREMATGLSAHADFVKGSRASPTEVHDVVFVVKEKNMEELKRILFDVSDPDSPNYGNHLTPQQIEDLVSNPEAHKEVVAYLTAAGATVMHGESKGECITARAEIGVWESMLNTEFHVYSLISPTGTPDWPTSQTDFFRTEKYSVPNTLDDHVAYVMNTVQTPTLKFQRDYLEKHNHYKPVPQSKFSETAVKVAGYTSVDELLKAYNIKDNSGHPKSTQAAWEAFGQKFCPEDLTLFQKFYELPQTPAAETYGPAVYTIDQCKAAGLAICTESNVDMMYLMAMSQTPTIHYYSTFNTFAQWAQFVANSGTQPPLIISISYGNDENLYSEGEYSLFESSTLKIGAMGCTILIAAGDDGVHTGQVRNNAALCGYKPQYPTGCPYVISVGATQVRYTSSILLSFEFILELHGKFFFSSIFTITSVIVICYVSLYITSIILRSRSTLLTTCYF